MDLAGYLSRHVVSFSTEGIIQTQGYDVFDTLRAFSEDFLERLLTFGYPFGKATDFFCLFVMFVLFVCFTEPFYSVPGLYKTI